LAAGLGGELDVTELGETREGLRLALIDDLVDAAGAVIVRLPLRAMALVQVVPIDQIRRAVRPLAEIDDLAGAIVEIVVGYA